MHTGNTEGWARIVYTLLNPGDSLLVEVSSKMSHLLAHLSTGMVLHLGYINGLTYGCSYGISHYRHPRPESRRPKSSPGKLE